MIFEARRCLKHPPAHITRILPVRVVNLLMHTQVAGCDKLLAAQLTLVGPFAGVGPQMDTQIALACATFAAQTALIGLGVAVCLLVSCEMAVLAK